ncbi:SPFH domain-containing protein [Spiroplasma endosymbiont of Dilophus febrilis]|uniref:SPFH domain-containing protein n=1 Tax=Spiroplasma endosymbiont of Dilophus febrilis TaxID=3066292 RepID=UPI00313CCD7D
MNIIGIAVIIVLALIMIITLVTLGLSIRIVPQSHQYVIERLGKYFKTWTSGLHFKIPFIDRVVRDVNLKEQVMDFPPQDSITKDNVIMKIDTVIFFQVTDAKLFAYGAEDPYRAIENLSATTLRNVIGELELDETLTSREKINNKLRIILDEASDAWGVKVIRVEVKNIIPPHSIIEAMEKQMRAEREKRESILKAEGFRQSKILEAEGIKQSEIMKAEGKARAVELDANAKAEAIKLINDAQPAKEYIALEAFKSFEKVADGNAVKIVVPSELATIASTATILKEIFQHNNNKNEK